MSETVYERLFGTPERAAEFFVRNCSCDCYACHLPEDAPCFERFSVYDSDIPKMVEWLEGEAK